MLDTPPRGRPEFAASLDVLFPAPLPRPVQTAVERLLALDRLASLYEAARRSGGADSIFDAVLGLLGVKAKVSEEDLARIPRTGPVVAVANHPYGLLEGPVLGSLLPRVRGDVRILANTVLGAMPEIARHCILVNPFGGAEAARENARGLREAIEWLRRGGMLVIFPAGEVAHVNPRALGVLDPAWNPAAARLIRRTGAAAVPFYFAGANSALFQLLGLLHPRLRTVLLPHEFLNKRRVEVELRIGHAVSAGTLDSFADAEALTAHLRERVYLLGRRERPRRRRSGRRRAALAAAIGGSRLAEEIAGLSEDRCLASQGRLAAYLGRAAEIPSVLAEIGRLRELAFRRAGEGTGFERDLDRFDGWYEHLFLWNREKQEIAGAYRIGDTEAIVPLRGAAGLYTHTMFSYGCEFLRRLGPALELGRSFVHPDYQKSYAPLLLLWKAIGAVVAARPESKTLFGAVSISNDYQAASRRLIAHYLEEAAAEKELGRLVRPRRPLRRIGGGARGVRVAGGLDELSAWVADLEADGKGVPVLLRQYLNLGARVAALSVDHRFSDTLDGLMVVDLTGTRPAMLERTMGREAARAFLAYHARGARGARGAA
jgi:putative hemolysin